MPILPDAVIASSKKQIMWCKRQRDREIADHRPIIDHRIVANQEAERNIWHTNCSQVRFTDNIYVARRISHARQTQKADIVHQVGIALLYVVDQGLTWR